MVEKITVTGMVISGMPIGEYDKRLVIITKELGKITAFARGARKPTSSFQAGSQPMAFGEFTLYKGRNSYTVTGMRISKYFSNSLTNLDGMYMGMYFLELTDYYGREGIEASETLKLLYLSLKVLGKNVINTELIRCIFELRMLVINGEYPNVFTCGSCGGNQNLDYFDLNRNTLLCSNCHGKISWDSVLENSTVYALQFIVTAPLNNLYTFQVTDVVLKQLRTVIGTYMNKHIDKKFNSLEFTEN